MLFLIEIDIQYQGQPKKSATRLTRYDIAVKLSPHFRTDDNSTFRALVSASRLTSKVVKGTFALPDFYWLNSENYTEYMYKTHQIHVDSFYAMAHDLEDQLFELYE